MAGWWEGPMVGFDTETTGVDVTKDRIVTAAVVRVARDGSIDHGVSRTWLVNPGVDIPAEATGVHGITTEQARADGLAPAEVLPQIVGLVAHLCANGAPLVVMNASFDLAIVDHELDRHGLGSLTAHWPNFPRIVDPMVMDRHCDERRRGKRRLENLAHLYQAPLDEMRQVAFDDAHTAGADAAAAALIARRIAHMHGGIRRRSLVELQTAQARWHAERSEDFQRYLREQGETDRVIDGAWPYRPAASEVAA